MVNGDKGITLRGRFHFSVYHTYSLLVGKGPSVCRCSDVRGGGWWEVSRGAIRRLGTVLALV